jgi:hypothetical protein
MNIADELARLQELHRSGALTDDDFAAAKAAVQSAAVARVEAGTDPARQENLEETKLQDDMARLDREWKLERKRYMVMANTGRRYIPKRGLSVIAGVVIVAYTLFGTVMVAWATFGFGGRVRMFPLLGVLLIFVEIGMCIYYYSKAAKYEVAYQAYQHRRAQLLAGSSAQPSRG